MADIERQLFVKAQFHDREEVKTLITSLFVKRGELNLFKVRRSDASRAEYGCVNAECEMFIRLSLKKGVWVIGVSTLQHSCDRATSDVRQRAIKTAAIREFVPAVESIALVGGKRGAAVRDMVAKAIGVELKPTQALALAKVGREDPSAIAVLEFCFIEAYIAKLAESDMGGTYKFASEESDDGTAFYYTYVATSAAKNFWRHGHRHLIAVDATFLVGPLKGFFFAAVTKDANNELVVLAFGQMKKENKDIWDLFLRFVKEDFQGIKLILCDKQKGLEACQRIIPLVRFGRCSHHMLDNVADKDNKLGDISPEFKVQYWRMIKAPTEVAYNEARAKAETINAAATAWVHERRHEVAEFVFLAEGIKRFGDSTSNMAEEFFSVVSRLDMKEMSIIQLHQRVLVWQSQRMYASRAKVVQFGGNARTGLSQWVTDLIEKKF